MQLAPFNIKYSIPQIILYNYSIVCTLSPLLDDRLGFNPFQESIKALECLIWNVKASILLVEIRIRLAR